MIKKINDPEAGSGRNPVSEEASRRTTSELIFLIWDITVVALVSLNLGLILFDSLFAVKPLAGLLESLSPTFHAFYADSVHEHFAEIDLVFVAIFALDVLAGWTIAAFDKRYERWWIYPFAHWYDVLGCIPLAGFRVLRVLRLITIGFRLQKLGVIDVRNWTLFQIAAKWYGVLVEEISDRVVINVLSGVQDEIRDGGGDLPRQVISQVIAPRKEQLINVISDRLERTVGAAYGNNRAEIRAYVARMVERAVLDNAVAKNVERVPMLGSYLTDAIDNTITDAVCNVLEEAVNGFGTQEYEQMVSHITDSVFEQLLGGQGDQESAQSRELSAAMIEVIDLVKAQVAVKRWKLPQE